MFWLREVGIKPANFWSESKIKIAIYPPTHNLHTGNIFRHIQNQVRRFYVGGDIAIWIFGSFQKFGCFYTDPISPQYIKINKQIEKSPK